MTHFEERCREREKLRNHSLAIPYSTFSTLMDPRTPCVRPCSSPSWPYVVSPPPLQNVGSLGTNRPQSPKFKPPTRSLLLSIQALLSDNP